MIMLIPKIQVYCETLISSLPIVGRRLVLDLPEPSSKERVELSSLDALDARLSRSVAPIAHRQRSPPQFPGYLPSSAQAKGSD